MIVQDQLPVFRYLPKRPYRHVHFRYHSALPLILLILVKVLPANLHISYLVKVKDHPTNGASFLHHTPVQPGLQQVHLNMAT
jgi:hypothetical protein